MLIDRERGPSSSGPARHEDAFTIPNRLPVFPLPNVVFFQKTYLPLHMFEPRDRRMVADVTMGGQSTYPWKNNSCWKRTDSTGGLVG